MDGIDVAEVKTDGVSILEFGQTQSQSFTPEEQKILIQARGKWPGEEGVAKAAQIIEDAHIKLCNNFARIELIGFHGQTLVHDPLNKRTHQAGDAAKIADCVNRPVVSNFREGDLKNSGQGAPLVPFFHHALCQYLEIKEITAIINIGGIANLTLVNPIIKKPELNGVINAFDIGPGNYLMDKCCQKERNVAFDRNGDWARKGNVKRAIVNRFITSDFLQKLNLQSADLSDFNDLLDAVNSLTFYDKLATLLECTAVALNLALHSLPMIPKRVGIGGGGAANGFLVERIQKLYQHNVETVNHWGVDPQYVEAQAFAFLAVRSWRGLPITSPATTNCLSPSYGGIIFEPNHNT